MKPKINDNGLRSGRLSNEEKEQLQTMYKTMSIEEMAQQLNRRVDAVQVWADMYVPKVEAIPENDLIVAELHNKIYWKNLQNQFLEEELRSFEVYWVGYINQFNNDIEFSEEVQLVDLIIMILLSNRNLVERAKAKREIEILQRKLDEFTTKNGYPSYYQEDGETPDIIKFNEYSSLIQGVKFAESGYQSRTSELKTLTDKKDAYQDELKATRKQRIEVLKNIKKDFVGLIKSLMDDKIRTTEGLETALMNKAAEKELERLSEIHIYANGEGDRPILNNEVLEKVKDENSN